ncbi:hypothetical protein E2C01_058370 [Portunus trituberculatus]|uniref:Uncharacterized protein n=1 Tax=Portunus trituberculatus TaxID=210409 RepID=A0A5B7H559_PORTR|nr:hypothetical protein [Portunus trituberculatus]
MGCPAVSQVDTLSSILVANNTLPIIPLRLGLLLLPCHLLHPSQPSLQQDHDPK